MWSNKYIGIPFQEKGRDFTGLDCWGLVRLIYDQEFNIKLPSFTDSYNDTNDGEHLQDLISQHKENWAPSQPKEGAVVLFRIMGHESHVGVCISETHFIHVREGQTTVVESLGSITWKNRLIGFFEYEEKSQLVANVVPHPLRTQRYVVPVTPGTTLDQLASLIALQYGIAEELKAKVTIIVNGRVIPESGWKDVILRDTDTIEYRAVPKGGNGFRMLLVFAVAVLAPYAAASLVQGSLVTSMTAVAGIAAASPMAYAASLVAVNLVGSALINAIAPIRMPPEPKDPGNSERQLMVEGSANRASPYEAIPVVLGKVKMTPPLGATNYLTYDNDRESFLTTMVAWGYGPLTIDYATLKIGNVAIADYTIEKQAHRDRKGTETQQQIDDFNAIYGSDVNQIVKNIELTCDYNPEEGVAYTKSVYNPTTTLYENVTLTDPVPTPPGPYIEAASTSPNGADSITVALHFPQGLRKVKIKGDGAGDSFATTVRIEAEYKIGSGSWQSWAIWAFGSDSYKKDAFTVTKSIDVRTDQLVQVRLRRLTGAHTDDNPEWRYSHQVYFLSATFIKNTKPFVDPLNCKIAASAFKIRASDELNGQIEGINAIVQTYALSWTGSAWTLANTNNPADLFRYVLQHPANPHAITNAEVAEKINLTQIQYWAQYCKQKGFTYNGLLGSQRSVLEVLRDICAAGRASPTLVDGKWSVVIDEPKANIVQHFSPHNSWNFEATRALPKLPDGLRITYYDEEQDYQEAEIIVYNQGKNYNNAAVFESISLPGVTKQSLVVDHAKWHMAQALLRREIYTLNTDLEYLVCNRGDRVKVTHHVPLWGNGSGRVKTVVDSSNIIVDEPVYMEAGKSYVIRVRGKDGRSTVKSLVNSGTGWHDTLTLDSPSTLAEIDASDLFLFGELGQESQDLIVLSIEPTDGKNARITFVDYGVTNSYNIFTDYLTLTENVVFETNITLPGGKPGTGFTSEQIPFITSVTSDQFAAVEISPGNFAYRIKVAYGNVSTFLPNTTQYVECQYDLSSATSNANYKIERVPYLDGTIYLPNVQKGETYKIRLRYATSTGQVGLWSAPVTHTVAGRSYSYGDVTGLNLVRTRKNLQMTPIVISVPTSFKYYEYRVWQSPSSGGDTDDFWNLDPATNSDIKIVTATGAGLIDLTTFDPPRMSEGGVKYRVACRIVDSTNNYSLTSAVATYTLKSLK